MESKYPRKEKSAPSEGRFYHPTGAMKRVVGRRRLGMALDARGSFKILLLLRMRGKGPASHIQYLTVISSEFLIFSLLPCLL